MHVRPFVGLHSLSVCQWAWNTTGTIRVPVSGRIPRYLRIVTFFVDDAIRFNVIAYCFSNCLKYCVAFFLTVICCSTFCHSHSNPFSKSLYQLVAIFGSRIREGWHSLLRAIDPLFPYSIRNYPKVESVDSDKIFKGGFEAIFYEGNRSVDFYNTGQIQPGEPASIVYKGLWHNK